MKKIIKRIFGKSGSEAPKQAEMKVVQKADKQPFVHDTLKTPKMKALDAENDRLQKVAEEINKGREKKYKEIQKEMIDSATKKLNTYLNMYFGSFSDIPEDNKISFDLIEAEWQDYCKSVNVLKKKYGALNLSQFADEVKRITGENKQFQQTEK